MIAWIDRNLDAIGVAAIWCVYFLHAQGLLTLTPEAIALLGSAGAALRGIRERNRNKEREA